MGQGSRGGKGGVSASGRRQRDDKAQKGPRRYIPRSTNPGRSGEGNGGGAGSSGSSGSSKSRRNRNWPNNFPNWLVPHLQMPNMSGSGSGKKGSTKKASKKTVKPPAAKKDQGIKPIRRIKPVRVKLTKQRVNKTPN